MQQRRQDHMKAVREAYSAATKYDPTWYKAWHALASSHFAAVKYYKERMRILREEERTNIQRQQAQMQLPLTTHSPQVVLSQASPSQSSESELEMRNIRTKRLVVL